MIIKWYKMIGHFVMHNQGMGGGVGGGNLQFIHATKLSS